MDNIVLIWMLMFMLSSNKTVVMQFQIDHCQINSEYHELNPYNISSCSTCLGNCGKMFNTRNFFCSCDPACVIYDECCPDFQSSCPAEYTKSLYIAEKYAAKQMQSTCQIYGQNFPPTKLITTCPSDSAVTCEPISPFDIVPVTDLDTGVEFVNGRCAACNGVTNGSAWDSILYCDEFETISSKLTYITAENTTATNTTAVIDAIDAGECDFRVQYQIPSIHAVRECSDYETGVCDMCGIQTIKDMCDHGYTQYVTDSYQTYRNIYCAMCAPGFQYVECGMGMKLPGGREFYKEFSFAVLFDFNPVNDGSVDIRADPDHCEAGTEWINEDVGCKQVVGCSPDYIMLNNICTLQWSKFHFSFTLSVLFKGNISIAKHDLILSTILSQAQLIGERKTNLTERLHDYNVKLADSNTNINRIELKFESSIKINVLNISTIEIQHSLDELIDCLMEETYFYSELWIRNISSFESLTLSAENSSYLYSHANLNCSKLIVLSGIDYKVNANNSIVVLGSNEIIEEGDFIKENGSVYVCKPADNTRNNDNSGINTVTGILTLVLMTLSVLGLFVRLVLQPFVPVYSGLPMKLQFQMCVAMFVSFVLYLISPLLNLNYIACKIIAVLIHWGFLSLFGWVTIISAETWNSFRGFGIKQGSRNTKCKVIMKYILIGWGVPLFWVISGVVVDELLAEPHPFKPSYGTIRCWMNTNEAILIFFAVPFGITLILNTVFYSLTAYNLRRAFQDRQELTQAKKERHFSLYIKLFLLMGITWILGFVAPFVDHIAMWIIFILLNASQGIFIFIAFVCTKPVFEAVFKSRCTGDGSSRSSNNTSSRAAKYTTKATEVHVTTMK